MDPDNFDSSELETAGQILRDGGLVAFPTETVYGLGGNALDSKASEKIYSAKGRPSDNPLIVHIGDISSLDKIVREVPECAKKLMEKCWPGPLTLIFKKSDIVPKETTGGLDTVAVRYPSHPIANALIKGSGVYVAAPSANLSGRPSPTRAEHVIEDLDGRVDMIIGAGSAGIGLESTIVDVSGDTPCILRPGFFTEESIREIIGDVDVDPVVLAKTRPNKDMKAKAPGMKYRHYAPKGEMTIVDGERTSVAEYINGKVNEGMSQGKKIAIITCDENKDLYMQGVVMSLGSRKVSGEIAGHVFDTLRQMDELGVQEIYAECFDGCSLGTAVMNRLRKAAGYNVVNV